MVKLVNRGRVSTFDISRKERIITSVLAEMSNVETRPLLLYKDLTPF